MKEETVRIRRGVAYTGKQLLSRTAASTAPETIMLTE